MINMAERVAYPILKPLQWLVTIDKRPEATFFVIVVLFYVLTDFILTVVNVFAQYTHMTHIFIGLSIISWGMSLIELINLSIASKNNEM